MDRQLTRGGRGGHAGTGEEQKEREYPKGNGVHAPRSFSTHHITAIMHTHHSLSKSRDLHKRV